MPIQKMLSNHPQPPQNAELLARCIDECFACAAICTSCADACLAEPKVEMLRRCISPEPELRRPLPGDRQRDRALYRR
jgi:hypothetical protein